MEMDALLDPFNWLLVDVCVRGATTVDILHAVDASGFLDVLVTEDKSGAGLTLLEAEPLFRALGRLGAPADVALAMDGRASDVTQPLSAVAHSMLIVGGIETLLAMSIDYANTRVQFGKPIGKQQAIQHQIALLAEQAALVRVAAQYGAAGGLDPSPERAAVAKHTASAAVPLATSVAHAVHGAIGVTEEFDLQLYTKPLHAWRIATGSESYWAMQLGALRLASPDTPSVDFVREIV